MLPNPLKAFPAPLAQSPAACRVRAFAPNLYQGCLRQTMPFTWHQLVQTAHCFFPFKPILGAVLFFAQKSLKELLILCRFLLPSSDLMALQGKWLEGLHLTLPSPLAHPWTEKQLLAAEFNPAIVTDQIRWEHQQPAHHRFTREQERPEMGAGTKNASRTSISMHGWSISCNANISVNSHLHKMPAYFWKHVTFSSNCLESRIWKRPHISVPRNRFWLLQSLIKPQKFWS